MYMQARNGLGEIDWGDLLKTAVGAYGTVQASKQAVELAKIQSQQNNMLQNPFAFYAQNPNYSGTYAPAPVPVSGAANLVPWLLIGGVALAAFFILKK